MTSPVITVAADATVGEAARLMLERNISALPVLDEGENLVGILSHTDFGLSPRYRPLAQNVYSMMGATITPRHVEEVSRQVSSKRVREVMRRQVVTAPADAPIAQVTETMLNKHIHRLPVMEGNKLAGIITRHDFLKLIAPGATGE